MRKIVKLIMMLCMLTVMTDISLLNQVQAKEWSKKEVQEELKRTKNELKKSKKELNKYYSQYTGPQYVHFYGEVLGTQPFLVKDNLSFSSYAYYLVQKPQHLWSMTALGTGIASGTIKLTGRYLTYGNITFAEGIAMKTKKPPKKLKNKVKKLEEKVENLKDALKNKAEFEGYFVLTKGATYKNIWKSLSWDYTEETYNEAYLETGNSEIATINSKGDMKAKQVGKTSVSAITTVSEKKTSTTCYVVPKDVDFKEKELEISMDGSEEKEIYLSFNKKLPKGISKLLVAHSDNEEVAKVIEVNDKGVKVNLLALGKAKISFQLSGDEDGYYVNRKWIAADRDLSGDCLVKYELPKDIGFQDEKTEINTEVREIYLPFNRKISKEILRFLEVKSDNGKVAKVIEVNEDGAKIKMKAPGEAGIGFKLYGGKGKELFGTCLIKYEVPQDTKFTENQTSQDIRFIDSEINTSADFQELYLPFNRRVPEGMLDSLVAESSDTSVAQIYAVDSVGVRVILANPGETVISFRLNSGGYDNQGIITGGCLIRVEHSY